MPSKSLVRWQTDARSHLDDIVSAHAAVAGAQRGRRAAAARINPAEEVVLEGTAAK